MDNRVEWSPHRRKDIEFYNVYRKIVNADTEDVIEDKSLLTKVRTTYYEDRDIEHYGARYIYQVSAVSESGEESPLSDEMVHVIYNFKFVVDADVSGNRVFLNCSWLEDPGSALVRQTPALFVFSRREFKKGLGWQDWYVIGDSELPVFNDFPQQTIEWEEQDEQSLEYKATAYDAQGNLMYESGRKQVSFNVSPPPMPRAFINWDTRWSVNLRLFPKVQTGESRSRDGLTPYNPNESWESQKDKAPFTRAIFWPLKLDIQARARMVKRVFNVWAPVVLTDWSQRATIDADETDYYDNVFDIMDSFPAEHNILRDNGQVKIPDKHGVLFEYRIRYLFDDGKLASGWTILGQELTEAKIGYLFYNVAPPRLEFALTPEESGLTLDAFTLRATLVPGPRIEVSWDGAVTGDGFDKFMLWRHVPKRDETMIVYGGRDNSYSDFDIFNLPGEDISYRACVLDRWGQMTWSNKVTLRLDKNLTGIEAPLVISRHPVLDDLAPIYAGENGIGYLWDRHDEYDEKESKIPANWAAGFFPKFRFWFQEKPNNFLIAYFIDYFQISDTDGKPVLDAPGAGPYKRQICYRSPVTISMEPEFERGEKIYCKLGAIDILGNVVLGDVFTIYPRQLGGISASRVPYYVIDQRDFYEKEGPLG
jgi:hypothetical protein